MPSDIDPYACLHTTGYETAEGGATNFICARCGALVNNTPFGKKLLITDARRRFPDYAHLHVQKWAEDEEDAKEGCHDQ